MRSDRKKCCKSMGSVENPDAIVCPYHYYGCTEPSCLFNEFFVPDQACFGITGIPWEKCPGHRRAIEIAICDESIDIAIRIWMEDVFIKNQRRPPPPEITEFLYGNSAEMEEPPTSWLGVKDV